MKVSRKIADKKLQCPKTLFPLFFFSFSSFFISRLPAASPETKKKNRPTDIQLPQIPFQKTNFSFRTNHVF